MTLMLELLALAVVVLTAAFLLGLAAAAVFLPKHAAHFLNGFASSARAHYSEIGLRLIVGAALIVAAPNMLFAKQFMLFGWLIVVTSLVLLCVPWRWHQRFAQSVLPPITKRVWLFALLALPLAAVIFYAVLYATTA